MKNKVIFAILVAVACFAVRLVFSSPHEVGIVNIPQHKKNKAIFARVMEKSLERYPSAELLSLHIGEIAKDLLCHQDFLLTAYNYEKHPDTGELCFVAIPIWEGKERVPLTFFLYVWPSKQEALKTEKAVDNAYYSSNIHAHPISCAFTVLQESITQYCYLKEESHPLLPVKQISRKTFFLGEQEVDLNHSPVIHQLVFEGSGKKAAITCHAYGKPTAELVKAAFKSAQKDSVYLHMLSPDGEIVSRSW